MRARFRTGSDHDRARELAAWRVDSPLEAAEDAWLDAHLAGCPDCAAAAAGYEHDRRLFLALRDAAPEPPRDLWARTAAALDVERERHGAPVGSGQPVASHDGLVPGSLAAAPAVRSGWIPASIAIAAVAVIAVGAGLLNGQPAASPDLAVALATPMAVSGANVQVLSQGADGHLQISTRNVNEVCPIGADTCSVAPSAETSALAAVPGGASNDEAILSPSRDRLVVVQRGESSHGVYVVPVTTDGAAGGAPAETPPVATPAPASTEPAVTAAPAATPTVEPATPVPTVMASPVPTVTASPEATPAVSNAPPTGSPDTTPAATEPVPSVEPTPVPTDAPTAAPETPSPTPVVEVSPGPGDAIQIASDVIVLGSVAAYNEDGTRFAFTARPADGSHGPDVYVWNTSKSRARAVTDDHRSVFAGWHEGHLVVSRLGDDGVGTWFLDPSDGSQVGDQVSDGWLPTLSPDDAAAVWWDGVVRFAADGVTPVTRSGRLVLGPWQGQGSSQTLAEGRLRDWQVQWDPTGKVLAVWTASDSADEPGSLSLYRVDDGGVRVDLKDPILADEPAFDGFNLDVDHLAWPVKNASGERVIRVLAWNEAGKGTVDLPADAGSTIIR